MEDRSKAETVRIPAPAQIVAGRYRIIERVGSGGMGYVFLAEQVAVGNKVAVKFLDPEPTPDRAVRVARFLQEAKVSLAVHHPGAAQLLDSGMDDERGYLFLVFEYVEGLDLREILRAEWRLSFEEAREIAVRIAEPLAFAHAKGIVHRDIKPENVRIRRDLAGPHVKVLDFGIAKLIGPTGVRLTAEGLLAGTPRYMAPEQVKDAQIDGRTDVYALGLVFFEMLAGQPAYDGVNFSKLMLRQVQEPMPRLASIAPDLGSPQIDAFLATACAKDPAARFQSMEEFVLALKALPVPAWPKPPSRPPAPSVAPGISVTVPSAKKNPADKPVSSKQLEAVTEPSDVPLPAPRAMGQHTLMGAPVPRPRRSKLPFVFLALSLIAGAAAATFWLWRLH